MVGQGNGCFLLDSSVGRVARWSEWPRREGALGLHCRKQAPSVWQTRCPLWCHLGPGKSLGLQCSALRLQARQEVGVSGMALSSDVPQRRRGACGALKGLRKRGSFSYAPWELIQKRGRGQLWHGPQGTQRAATHLKLPGAECPEGTQKSGWGSPAPACASKEWGPRSRQ